MFAVRGIWLTSATARRALPLAVAALLIAAVCVASVPRVHAAAATMTVNTTTDGDVGDAVLTLHEAIKLATGTLGVSALFEFECAQVSSSTYTPPCSTTDTIGPASADTIIFATGTFNPDSPATINVNVGTPTLPTLSTGNDTVSGVGAGVIVDGDGADCFRILGESSDSNVIKGLEITGCSDAVEISGGADSNTVGGTNAAESTCTGSADDDADGYRNDGCPVVMGSAEGPKCTTVVDDDGDTEVNDGCPAVGAAESGGQCSGFVDDDADTWVNDGCPVFSTETEGAQCLNAVDDDGDATVNDGCLARGGGNVIRGNIIGIRIDGSASVVDSNVVAGNLIGTDFDGIYDLGNTTQGVEVYGSPSNTIGGTLVAARNVISGNGGDGVRIIASSATGNTVAGNYIGTNAAGTGALGNGGAGVYIESASSNTVGGLATTTGAPPGNVISANASGIVIKFDSADGNIVRGNLIGTNAAGTADLGNADVGVYLSFGPDNTLIGGTASGARNVISGNNNRGVAMFEDSTGTLVEGNYIGTDITGTAAMGSLIGVTIANGATGNTIGGTTAASRNVISGNTQYGVRIGESTAADSNSVAANYIGVNAAGTDALGNGTSGTDHGVYIATGSSNCIGGTIIATMCTPAAATGNTITDSGGDGVYVATGIGNHIRRNSIYKNGGLGIDLGTDYVTVNDLGDVDSGPNNLQNFPVITSAVYDGINTTVTGTLDSPGTPTVDVYTTDFADPSGNGEGRAWLGSTTASGGVWTLIVAGAPAYGIFTATATNSTSEFSDIYTATVGDGVPLITVAYDGQDAPGVGVGATFTGFGPAQVPNTTGDIVFFATVSSAAGQGIFKSTGGVLSKLVAAGDPAPVGGTYMALSIVPSMNAGGDIAFWASLSLFPFEAIFHRTSGGTVTKIVASGDAAPPSVGGTYLTFVVGSSTPLVTINNLGDISFLATLSTSSDGVFLYSGVSTTELAVTGDAAPGGGAFAGFTIPIGFATVPVVTENQQVSFLASTSGGPAQGIYLYTSSVLTRVVATGDVTPVGGTFSAFGRAPGPNDSGKVTFAAAVSGTSLAPCPSWGASGDSCGVFTKSGGVVSKVAAVGDAGPAGIGGTISGVGNNALMNDNDQTSFWVSTTGFAAQALVRHTAGTLKNIAAIGNAAPTPIVGTFSDFIDAGLFATTPLNNNMGRVAFWGETTDGLRPEGIFITNEPDEPQVQPAALSGNPVPGSGGTFGSNFDLDITDNGTAVFANTVTDGTATAGIFRFFAGSALEDVALQGETAPSPDSDDSFSTFGPPVGSDSGDIVARVTLADAATTADEGLYRFFAGSSQLLAIEGQNAGISGDPARFFAGFADPAINDAGTVTAKVTLDNGQDALYRFFAGSYVPEVLRLENTAAPPPPAAPPETARFFAGFSSPAIDDLGGIVAKVTTAESGGVNVKQALYRFFAGSSGQTPPEPVLVVREGDAAPEATARFFAGFADRPSIEIDRSTLQSNIAFKATLDNGDQVIYLYLAASSTLDLLARQGASAPPPVNGTYTQFGDPVVNERNQVVARGSVTGGSASEGLFLFFAGSAEKIVVQGDPAPTVDTGDSYGGTPPIFPYIAYNNGAQLVYVAKLTGGSASQGVFIASLDNDNDGVIDHLDNCEAAFNTDQNNTDRALANAGAPASAITPDDLGNSCDDDDDGEGVVDASDLGACRVIPDCDGDSNAPQAYTVCKGPCPHGGFNRDNIEFWVGTSMTDRCADDPMVGNEIDDKWPPDYNDDRKVSALDFTYWKVYFPDAAPLNSPAARRSDLSGDNAVSALDFPIWKTYFPSDPGCLP